MTDTLNTGDTVIAARTTVRPAHVRKNGEPVPEKTITKLREGVLLSRESGGWIVQWSGVSRRYTEHYFNHEITKLGTNPLAG